MAPSRAYIPSRVLIRALSRPQPLRCPLARRLPTRFIRNKSSKPSLDSVKSPKLQSLLAETEKRNEDMKPPRPDKTLDSDDLPTIEYYEQDLDSATPKRLISRLDTAEDIRKDKEMYEMIEQSDNNPHYDNAELNRRLIDSLISNPNFADLAEDLREIKDTIKSKEELKELDEQAEKEAQPEIEAFNASLRMEMHQAIQSLIDDPKFVDAKPELQEVLENMPEPNEIDNPEFLELLQNATQKLEGNEAFQQKMAAMKKNLDPEKILNEMSQFEKEVDDAFNPPQEGQEEQLEDSPENLDKLLLQMKDVMKSLGGDSGLEAELNAVINEDPRKESSVDIGREVNPEELAEELKKLALASPPPAEPTDETEEKLDPELEAKIDKIMQDPKLMEKLAYIQKMVEEAQRENADITHINHDTAPDPETLDSDRTTTLNERMQIAKNDPEHLEALQNLRVTLPPPFHISPALKTFNQAIEFAYVGANDDIRRILWRAYSKARVLPTFLQSVSDDAWDILYYSQAVTWGANQNRQSHLKTLLADLKSVGRDGPPTHPSSLSNKGDGQSLEG